MVVVILVHAGVFRIDGLTSDPLRAGIGLALFVLGLAFAIWARLHIGRNWGTPMSQKGGPGAGDQRSVPLRASPDLLRHPGRRRRHRRRAELVVAHRGGPRRRLLHLQRDRRGALPDHACSPTPIRRTDARPRCSCPSSSDLKRLVDYSEPHSTRIKTPESEVEPRHERRRVLRAPRDERGDDGDRLGATR